MCEEIQEHPVIKQAFTEGNEEAVALLKYISSL